MADDFTARWLRQKELAAKAKAGLLSNAARIMTPTSSAEPVLEESATYAKRNVNTFFSAAASPSISEPSVTPSPPSTAQSTDSAQPAQYYTPYSSAFASPANSSLSIRPVGPAVAAGPSSIVMLTSPSPAASPFTTPNHSVPSTPQVGSATLTMSPDSAFGSPERFSRMGPGTALSFSSIALPSAVSSASASELAQATDTSTAVLSVPSALPSSSSSLPASASSSSVSSTVPASDSRDQIVATWKSLQSTRRNSKSNVLQLQSSSTASPLESASLESARPSVLLAAPTASNLNFNQPERGSLSALTPRTAALAAKSPNASSAVFSFPASSSASASASSSVFSASASTPASGAIPAAGFRALPRLNSSSPTIGLDAHTRRSVSPGPDKLAQVAHMAGVLEKRRHSFDAAATLRRSRSASVDHSSPSKLLKRRTSQPLLPSALQALSPRSPHRIRRRGSSTPPVTFTVGSLGMRTDRDRSDSHHSHASHASHNSNTSNHGGVVKLPCPFGANCHRLTSAEHMEDFSHDGLDLPNVPIKARSAANSTSSSPLARSVSNNSFPFGPSSSFSSSLATIHSSLPSSASASPSVGPMKGSPSLTPKALSAHSGAVATLPPLPPLPAATPRSTGVSTNGSTNGSNHGTPRSASSVVAAAVAAVNSASSSLHNRTPSATLAPSLSRTPSTSSSTAAPPSHSRTPSTSSTTAPASHSASHSRTPSVTSSTAPFGSSPSTVASVLKEVHGNGVVTRPGNRNSFVAFSSASSSAPMPIPGRGSVSGNLFAASHLPAGAAVSTSSASTTTTPPSTTRSASSSFSNNSNDFIPVGAVKSALAMFTPKSQAGSSQTPRLSFSKTPSEVSSGVPTCRIKGCKLPVADDVYCAKHSEGTLTASDSASVVSVASYTGSVAGRPRAGSSLGGGSPAFSFPTASASASAASSSSLHSSTTTSPAAGSHVSQMRPDRTPSASSMTSPRPPPSTWSSSPRTTNHSGSEHPAMDDETGSSGVQQPVFREGREHNRRLSTSSVGSVGSVLSNGSVEANMWGSASNAGGDGGSLNMKPTAAVSDADIMARWARQRELALKAKVGVLKDAPRIATPSTVDHSRSADSHNNVVEDDDDRSVVFVRRDSNAQPALLPPATPSAAQPPLTSGIGAGFAGSGASTVGSVLGPSGRVSPSNMSVASVSTIASTAPDDFTSRWLAQRELVRKTSLLSPSAQRVAKPVPAVPSDGDQRCYFLGCSQRRTSSGYCEEHTRVRSSSIVEI